MFAGLNNNSMLSFFVGLDICPRVQGIGEHSKMTQLSSR